MARVGSVYDIAPDAFIGCLRIMPFDASISTAPPRKGRGSTGGRIQPGSGTRPPARRGRGRNQQHGNGASQQEALETRASGKRAV
jgi:hypothetical protein